MRVLVTGATGFTGGHLARALAASGHRVRALVRPSKDRTLGSSGSAVIGAEGVKLDRSPVSELLRAGDGAIELAPGDLRDSRSLARAVAGVELVYNIAAIYRQAGLPAETYRAVNALAVGDLIEQGARAGVRRVVHCSTVGVHGDIEHPPADEDAPIRPGDVYQRTKAEGERVAREASAQAGVELVIVRPSGIYGPGDRRLLKLFRQAIRRLPTLGDGKIYYHLTYIDDLVEGFRLAGEHPAAAGRTYILAGGEVATLNEIVQVIAEVGGVKASTLHLPVWPFWIAGALCEAVCVPLGLEPPLYRRRVDFFTKSRAFDITRARTELGFTPRIGLREGVTRTLQWYCDHGWI